MLRGVGAAAGRVLPGLPRVAESAPDRVPLREKRFPDARLMSPSGAFRKR